MGVPPAPSLFVQMEGSGSNFKHEHLWIKLLNGWSVPLEIIFPFTVYITGASVRLLFSGWDYGFPLYQSPRSNCFFINKSRLQWSNMWNLHITYFLWVSGNDTHGNRREPLGCVVLENLLDHKSYQAGNSLSFSLSFKD